MRKSFQLLTLFIITALLSSVSFAKGRSATCDEYYSGKSLERKASRFSGAINHAAKKHGVSRDFIKAVITVESCFQPRARGSLGEKGLMQLMPATARKMEVKNGYNSWQNVDGGTRYLKYLLRRFNGNKRYAAAAYNGGPGAVSKTRGPRFPQVRRYSRHVMRAYHKMNGTSDVAHVSRKDKAAKQNRESKVSKRNNSHQVKQGQTLSSISRTTGIPVKHLKALNRLSSVHLHVGQVLNLGTQVTKSKGDQSSKKTVKRTSRHKKLPRKKTYRVSWDQTLYSISRETGVSVQRLKTLNKLKSSTIKLGQELRLK